MPYRCPEHCTFQSAFILMTSFDPRSLKCKIQFKGNRRKNIIKYILSARYFSDTLLSTFTWHHIHSGHMYFYLPFNSDDSILNKANNNIIYFYTHYGLLNTFTCIIHSFNFILDIFLRIHYSIITLSFRAISNSENRILLSWIVGSKLQVYDSLFSPQ